MKTTFSKIFSWAIFPLVAFFSALTFELFVFPNNFAPAGVGGIATMVQYVFHFSAGYLTLLINVPLLIMAWFMVDKEFVFKTAIYALCFSGALLLLDMVDFGPFLYHTDNGTSTVLAPIAAGTINGALYAYAIRYHGSGGGTDVVAACIRHYRPEYSMVWLIFILNAVIAIASYFVYDFKFEPVICCLLYCFVNGAIGDRVLRGYDEALKFEIITGNPEQMAADLMTKLKHGVTVVPAEGMFTHNKKNLVICVVNKHQIIDVQRVIAQHPGSFAYITSVNSTVGNFLRVK